MSFGFITRDSSGIVTFSTDQRLVRVMAVERVLATDGVRIVNVPGLRQDRSWWITQCDLDTLRGPVAQIFDGYFTVTGPIAAGTSSANSGNGYIIIVGFG